MIHRAVEVFVGLASGLFVFAATLVDAQQAATAGATRPNLKVLQALPEAQLFPLMSLHSDSLGVRCDYCHVRAKPDFSKTPSNAGARRVRSISSPNRGESAPLPGRPRPISAWRRAVRQPSAQRLRAVPSAGQTSLGR